jgi:mRNA-degrading endonuclease RelE of RelBE toxin-antitoxin system
VARRRIERVIDELAKEPEKGKRLRGKLEGMRSHRAGNYRIVYIIENKVLYILSIRHRRNVYEESTQRTH